MVNAGNKWYAYIYVIDCDLSFAHAFFNYHVTVTTEEKTKELVDEYSSVLQICHFSIRSEESPMHFSFNRSKKVRDVDIFNTSAKPSTFLAYHMLF